MAAESGRGRAAGVDSYIETDYEALGLAFRLALPALSGTFYFVSLRKKWKQEFPEDYIFVTIGAVCMMGVIIPLPLSSVISSRPGYYLIPIQAMIFSRIVALRGIWWSKFLALAPTAGMLIFLVAWAALRCLLFAVSRLALWRPAGIALVRDWCSAVWPVRSAQAVAGFQEIRKI